MMGTSSIQNPWASYMANQTASFPVKQPDTIPENTPRMATIRLDIGWFCALFRPYGFTALMVTGDDTVARLTLYRTGSEPPTDPQEMKVYSVDQLASVPEEVYILWVALPLSWFTTIVRANGWVNTYCLSLLSNGMDTTLAITTGDCRFGTTKSDWGLDKYELPLSRADAERDFEQHEAAEEARMAQQALSGGLVPPAALNNLIGAGGLQGAPATGESWYSKLLEPFKS